MLPAAGLPWFLTLFGRDTLMTAYQTVAFGPGLAKGALLALAAFQGDKSDDFRDMEPGKILHELRMGELTELGLKPHSPYYGSADSTPLWLILLSEYWRWTRRRRARRRAARQRPGGPRLDRRVRRPRRRRLRRVRDALVAGARQPVLARLVRRRPVRRRDDAVPADRDGRDPGLRLRRQDPAGGAGRRAVRRPALAARLRGEAAALRERFERDFWIDARGGYYAIGLDGDKRQIDSLTSNIGQLLWSGIVSEERAAIVARQLMADALFSGWGVRTLSTDDEGFNPIGYHRGTVWPHDNSIIAQGLARYGFRDEANRIALAMLEAAAFSAYRLPEAFSGYARSLGRFPVPYPTACSPQAWATGAPLLLVRAMLGLEARDGQVTLDPAVPDEIGRVSIPACGPSARAGTWRHMVARATSSARAKAEAVAALTRASMFGSRRPLHPGLAGGCGPMEALMSTNVSLTGEACEGLNRARRGAVLGQRAMASRRWAPRHGRGRAARDVSMRLLAETGRRADRARPGPRDGIRTAFERLETGDKSQGRAVDRVDRIDVSPRR